MSLQDSTLAYNNITDHNMKIEKIHVAFQWDNDDTTPLLEGFYDLFQKKQLTDFTIYLADDTTIECHRNVLFVKSKFFSTLFTSGFKDKTSHSINLEHLKANCVKEIITFVYSNQLWIEWEMMDSFLEVAAYLDMYGLMEECDKYIYWKLTSSNAALWYSKAQTHDLPLVLKRLESEFVMDIMKSEDFLTISLDHVMNMLKCDTIELHEDEIVDVAMTWWKHNNSKDPQHKILSSVRLSHLSKQALDVLKHFLATQYKTQKEYMHRMQQLEDNLESGNATEKRLFAIKKLTPVFTMLDLDMYDEGDRTYEALHDTKNDTAKVWYCLKEVPDWFDTELNLLCPLSPHGFVVTGGMDTLRNVSTRCFMFHGIRHEWLEMPKMPEGRVHHRCVVVDNKLYMIGGDAEHSEPGTLCLDMNDMSWQKLPAMPEQWQRYYPRHCVAGDAKIFSIMCLKYDLHMHTEDKFGILSIFNIQENHWDIVDFPPGNAFDNATLAVRNNKVYMLCKNYDDRPEIYMYVYCYDVASQCWETLRKDKLYSERIGIVPLYGTDLVILVNGIVLKYHFEQNTWIDFSEELPLYTVEQNKVLAENSYWISEGMQWACLALPRK